jgi:hypothetical protein
MERADVERDCNQQTVDERCVADEDARVRRERYRERVEPHVRGNIPGGCGPTYSPLVPGSVEQPDCA